jgi:hypothetical protein
MWSERVEFTMPQANALLGGRPCPFINTRAQCTMYGSLEGSWVACIVRLNYQKGYGDVLALLRSPLMRILDLDLEATYAGRLTGSLNHKAQLSKGAK